MTAPATSLALAFIVLGAFARPAQSQRRAATDSAPAALVAQVLRDEEAHGYAPILRDDLGRGGWLAITDRVDLDGDGTAELIVQGREEVCGANNCATWVYRVTPQGYEQVLDANGIQSIEARKTVSHGYRDLLTSRHESADWSDLALYRFDGQRYRVIECSKREYGYLDARGRLHGLKKPRVTRVKCEGDEPE